MRLAPSYPINRYLVENSKEIEMIKILDDDMWKEDPLLRPEDDILLRKLQDMLQSTAEQLKELSEDLHKPQELLVKSLPTPLDEAFNEKVHIEEIVQAKFHGHKIVEPNQQSIKSAPIINLISNTTPAKSKTIQTDTPVRNYVPKKLERSITRLVHIDEGEILIETNHEKPKKAESVCYNEYSYKYEPKIQATNSNLKVQHMPSINIRSELKQQKVLQFDIMPGDKDETDNRHNNVAVVQLEHETTPVSQPKCHQDTKNIDKSTIRKVTKLSTCESSESFSPKLQSKYKIGKTAATTKSSARSNKTNKSENKNEQKRPGTSLEEWKRKLNSVYGQSSKLKKKSANTVRKKPTSGRPYSQRMLNNGEYIPYSQLTLGGVRLSDIENELSDSVLKKDAPLNDLLDKILSSKENSPRKQKKPGVVLSKSDEDLLNEVLDIENKVAETLSRDVNNHKKAQPTESESSKGSKDSKENENYDDDFEAADKSENTTSNDKQENKSPDESNAKTLEYSDENEAYINNEDINVTNSKFTKQINLSLKRTVDVYEYLHAVDKQDNATQSHTTTTISLKETQTSPVEDAPSVHPIRNNLWSSIDPRGEIQNMFKLEKDFIKKLIYEEYGDVLDQHIHKPSTSKDQARNLTAPQKHTQTSPTRVKSMMTSPTRTKHRMTSPLLRLTVDRQTSPAAPPRRSELQITEDLDISINLSSPRFNLRLPQTSSEVLANFDSRYRPSRSSVDRAKDATFTASSSATDVELSSDISSLGEITTRLKRKLRRIKLASTSEGSSSSTSDLVLPVKSEGEVSSSVARGSSLGQL